ncbi:MAG: SIMPL domain-containing protein [Muribaculaceae bacterium]|nr:SIMPL domain-containing protein [Muribaculaceae bacterium]
MKLVYRSLPALLIAVAIVVLGLAIKGGFDNIAFRDREVTVRGLAERQVKANVASWSANFTVTGNSLETLYGECQDKSKAIVSFLTQNKIPEADITVGSPSVYEPALNQYNSTPVDYKYAVTVTVNISTKAVDAVYALDSAQGVLLSQGIALKDCSTYYNYTDLNSIKSDMIAEATRNARKAADSFAEDSESKVGKIKTASQGQFSIDDVQGGKPYAKNVRVVSTVVYYLED